MTRVRPQVAAWGISFFSLQNRSSCSRGVSRKNRGRGALWKLPQLRKSNKVAFGNFFLIISSSCLQKPPHKTAPAFPQLPQRRLLSINLRTRDKPKTADTRFRLIPFLARYIHFDAHGFLDLDRQLEEARLRMD